MTVREAERLAHTVVEKLGLPTADRVAWAVMDIADALVNVHIRATLQERQRCAEVARGCCVSLDPPEVAAAILADPNGGT